MGSRLSRTAVGILVMMAAVTACSGVGAHEEDSVGSTAPPTTSSGDAHALRWVALGDSYSAGVGVPGTGGCGDGFPAAAFGASAGWRFAQGWPNRVSQVVIASCGGAVVSDVTGTPDGTLPPNGPSPDSQVAWAKGADVATITIGGNDVGFSDFGLECFAPTPKNHFGGDCPDVGTDDPAALYGLMHVERAAMKDPAGIWHMLEQRLANTYASIVRSMADGGRLLVLTYPIPFAIDHLSGSCGQSLSGLVTKSLTDVLTTLNPFTRVEDAFKILLDPVMRAYFAFFSTNALRANVFAERLDETIVSAVRDADATLGGPDRVHLIDWRTHFGPPQLRTMTVGSTSELVADNPTGVCQSDVPSDVNFISINAGDERNVNDAKFSFAGDSFHPTPAGYQTVLGEILAALEIIYPYGGADAPRRGASPDRPATCVVKPEAGRRVDFPTCRPLDLASSPR